MPGGDQLFKILKKTGGGTYLEFSQCNSWNGEFKPIWSIFAEVIHAITHNESIVSFDRVSKSKQHKAIFNKFFVSTSVSENEILIEFDYKKFDNIIKKISEFTFQIYKILSIEENFSWSIKLK